MRTMIAAGLLGIAFLAPAAHAQTKDVQVIKARGANAAGACAGSLDMLGQYMSRASTPDPLKIAEVQQARDFFADMPRFPKQEIAAAATAFVQLMAGRIRDAGTVAERQGVQREIVRVATGCFGSAKTEIAGARGATTPGQPQPAPAQPYTIEPLPVQPYTTQPLILDPVQPGTIQSQ